MNKFRLGSLSTCLVSILTITIVSTSCSALVSAFSHGGGGITPSGFVTNKKIFAPYADASIMLNNKQTLEKYFNQGVKNITLGFVQNGSQNGFNPQWSGLTNDQIKNLEQKLIPQYEKMGGSVAVSFGGANGTPIWETSESAAGLASYLVKFAENLHLSRLDFDIEGGAVEHVPAYTKLSQALKIAQDKFKSDHFHCNLSVTLPVLPTGFTDANALVDNFAKTLRTSFLVNLMAMDYGGSFEPDKMAINAENAASNVGKFLKNEFDKYGIKYGKNIYRYIGLTPMIGCNDVKPEIFTLNDQENLAKWAAKNGIMFLSMWSITRDHLGKIGVVSPLSSGVSESDYQFSHIAITNFENSGPHGPIGNLSGLFVYFETHTVIALEWDKTKNADYYNIYVDGSTTPIVSYGTKILITVKSVGKHSFVVTPIGFNKAHGQSQNISCDNSASNLADKPVIKWSISTQFNGGDLVYYNGIVYKVNWWINPGGSTPDKDCGTGDPYTKIGPIAGYSKQAINDLNNGLSVSGIRNWFSFI